MNGESHAEKKDGVSPDLATGRGENEEELMADGVSKIGTGQTEIQNGEEKKPSKLKEIWGRLGLDVPTLMMMFKYASSPISMIGF